MEETNTLSLALLDFVPNLAFLVGGIYLVRLAFLSRGKLSGQMMAVGTGLVFLGGILKAIWKLLVTLEVADIQLFSEAQFALLAPGFLSILVAVWMISQANLPRSNSLAAMAAWKIPFLVVMTLSNIGFLGLLTVIAFRFRVRFAPYFFILAVLCTIALAGMASGAEQTIRNQWIEEGINSAAQISFAFGSILLTKDVERSLE